MRTKMMILEAIWTTAILATMVVTTLPAFAGESADAVSTAVVEQVAELPPTATGLPAASPPATAPLMPGESVAEAFSRQLRDASLSLRAQIDLVKPVPVTDSATVQPAL